MDYPAVILTSVNFLIILTPLILTRTTDAVLHFQPINFVQNDSVDIIKQQELYVTKGVELKIICLYSLTEEINSKVNCSEIFWQWNEGRLENHNKSISQCLSILHIEKVWWNGKQTFFCVYKEYTNNRKLKVIENKSLVIISGEKPMLVPQPSIQWIEGVVEIAWMPNRDNNSIRETKYTVEYFERPQNMKTVLPSFCGIFPLNNCSHRTEYYCRASFPPRLLTSYSVKLVAENKFGKRAGNITEVSIPLSQQKMMLKPVKDLRVFLTKSSVQMKWSDVLHYVEQKKVWYKCQGSTNIHINFIKDDTFLISKDKLPAYTYCRFCVSRQRYAGGKFSCDKCNVIRTAEGIPNGTQKLKSCQHGSCPFARFGIFKNVTISWQLPNKLSWNGIISRQLIFYYEENERMLQNITIRDSNVTEWTLTKLKASRGYHAFMVICTKAGCSGRSNVIRIPRLFESSASFEFQFFSDKANTGLVIGLSLGILGLCFIGIFALLYIKRRALESGLPTLQAPPVATEQESSQLSPVQESEYNLLEWRDSAN